VPDLTATRRSLVHQPGSARLLPRPWASGATRRRQKVQQRSTATGLYSHQRERPPARALARTVVNCPGLPLVRDEEAGAVAPH
jgi:hypothetical protein